jgi:hypothetical protein
MFTAADAEIYTRRGAQDYRIIEKYRGGDDTKA